MPTPRPSAPARASLAKITRPAFNSAFPRKRLFRLLDEARSPLVWVSSPPGAGKTTLVSSWLAAREIPHLWYQLDAGDGDLGTFFHYLGLAARDAAPDSREPLPHLTVEYLAGLPVFARRYFEALAAQLEPPFVLVFDNYQDVPAASALHAVLCEGISALPRGFATIVISRTPPPPAQARPRASDGVTMIGWEELQLTLDEVKGIERSRKRKGAAWGSHEDLYRRTSGWAAGLVLLLEQDAAERSAQRFPDDRPHVLFDYFAGEIFAKLDERTQEVLLASALLPKMTASMVAELTGWAGADRLLAELHANNYFTVKRAQAEPAYEYHPLFGEFLLSRAQVVFSAVRLANLRKKAAALSEADGQVENAAELLRACGDHGALAQLVLRHARSLIEQGRSSVVEAWLSQLPAALRDADPWLSYWYGVCRLPFSPPQARAHFERAYERFKAGGDAAGRCLAWCAVVDSFVFEWGNFAPLERWVAEMEEMLRAQPRLPSPEIEAQVVCGMFVALMYVQPQHPDMPRWEVAVRRIILHGGDPRLQVKVGNHLLIYYTWWIGDLAKAGLLIDTLRAPIQQPGVAPLLQITWYTMAAAYHWMSAAIDECVACVDRGLEIGRTSGVHVWDMLLCSQGVFASLSSDDGELAARYLQRMEAILQQVCPMMDKAMYHYFRGWERLTRGELAAAREFAQVAVTTAEEAGARFPAAVMRNDLGRVLFHLGDADAALALIRRSREEGRAMNAQTIEYLTFVAEAEIAMARRDETVCVEHLRRALAVGRAQQFLNHTWWSSRVMARLYAVALAHGIEERYVAGVIRKRRLAPPADAALPENWPWPFAIRTLGAFAVLKDGEPMAFSGKAPRKPLELLKALIAAGGSDVNQCALIDALWPDLEGDNAQQAFETALYRLRKLLGDDAPLVLKDGKLTLDARYARVDAWVIERVFDDIETALRAGDAARLDALAARLHSLYAGHFLAEEAAPWALARRERLRSRFLHVLEQLGRNHEARGEWDAALRCYRRGLEIEPLAESLYYRLMRGHQHLGQCAEALAVYRRCRQTLATVLGVAPSREIEALGAALGASRAS